jgi:NDP-sugar pyrophosphorylase family protein
MLPVGGRPFVEYVVLQLRQAGVRSIILACGYLADQLREHFGAGDRFGVEIRYSIEHQPLGTGGAIRLALAQARGERVLIMNGDSILDANPRLVLDALAGDIIVAMALTQVADARRFGTVELSADGIVRRFQPAGGERRPALVNAGVYGAQRSLMEIIPATGPCSLEHDVLPGLAGSRLRGVPLDGYFIDIGVPETYEAVARDPRPILRAVAATNTA